MKKIISLFLVILMLFAFTACSKDGAVSDSKKAREYDETDPTAVLGEITNDFEDTMNTLKTKLDETFTAVGTTYDDYKKNKELIDEWINLTISESDALFERTKENSIAYFKLIASSSEKEDDDYLDDALDEYYDKVYDDAMDEYYDSLYDDAMDDLYDQYYDGIIDKAYDDLEYKEWSDASSECYKQWSNARSDIYEKWSNERSYVYGLWSEMNYAFCWDDNFDVDSIISEYDTENADAAAKKAVEDAKVYTDLDVIYEINSDGDAEVVGFSGEGNEITIDSEFEGEDVVRIADSAFEGCTTLEKVIMWADIEEIGNYAFKGCNGLTEFSIPSDTTLIGHHAFEDCTNLEDLTIWGDPDIGDYAFANCVSLSEISIGSDTKNIGNHAFEGCTGMKEVTIWGVEIIGDYAFAGCTSIEKISFPSDVLSIGNHAFDGCSSLSSVTIWGDDTAIGTDAFANCPKLNNIPSSKGTVLESTIKNENNANNNKTSISNQNKETESSDGMRPEFKEAMDSYEEFYREYCEFLKEYNNNSSDAVLLAKYLSMQAKLLKMDEAFEEWDTDDLSDEELQYYFAVNNRVAAMLLEVSQ